ncbi:DUF3103 family protein [Streptomyces sp. NPDC088725]|uniref:DUF3103 family protein n=1 Tax=Streptomyces sp. NPDC088725 TaxID=3365873 RepID=UPI0037FA7149
MPRKRHSALALALSAVTVAALMGIASPAAVASQPAPAPQAAPTTAPASAVSRIEEETARAVAVSLADRRWRAQVRTAALASDQVDLPALTNSATNPAGKALRSEVATADRRITAAKGLDAATGSLLRLRLAAPSMRPELTGGTTPLVAAATTDDDTKTVTAYDSQGRTHTLDARQAPSRPVYVIDIDAARSMTAGLDIINKEFAKRGLHPVAPARDKAAEAGIWTTRIDSVHVTDVQEPWPLGDAEIFSIVSGFGPDGKVRVDTVDMPYLDNGGTDYYPNQVLVNWSSYKYNLADVVMMEDDGDTNYQALAKAIADILLTVTDQGVYIPLVDAILDALPASWYTNDADYVDSWYALGKDSTGRVNGARGNGWMTVSPYFVDQL